MSAVANHVTDTTVKTEVVVNVSAQRAFELFTQEMASWWPESHHISGVPQAMVLEPRAGGRVYDRYADGKEVQWASVLTYDPPTNVRLAWHLNGEWTFDPDPNHASIVDVTFTTLPDGKTRVQLEHAGFERHAVGGTAVRDAVGSDDGWAIGLRAFADVASK